MVLRGLKTVKLYKWKTYNKTNLTLNLWKKKSLRMNRNLSEALLIKKSEGTLFSRLHLPSSSASFSGKIKKQKGRFSVTGNKVFERNRETIGHM